jgi:hypothetical protein
MSFLFCLPAAVAVARRVRRVNSGAVPASLAADGLKFGVNVSDKDVGFDS